MILYLQKYDIAPGKTDEFNEWAKTAIPQILKESEIIPERHATLGAFSSMEKL